MAILTLAAGVLLELVGWRGLLLCTAPFLATMLEILCFMPRGANPAAEPRLPDSIRVCERQSRRH